MPEDEVMCFFNSSNIKITIYVSKEMRSIGRLRELWEK